MRFRSSLPISPRRPLAALYLALVAGTLSLAATLAPRPAFAQERTDAAFFRQIDEAAARGEITPELALRNKFFYVFDPDEIDARYRVENPTPVKCATDLVREYLAARPSLSADAIAEIDGYLAASAADDASGKTGPGARNVVLATYDSPAGKFRMTYSTTGGNAVPADDVDPANGIPDYVEWCATYCDSSWTKVVDGLGFMAPVLNAGKYDIGFQQMGAYGFTTTSGAGTRIVIHRNLLGFPPNDDPDGDQKGAAKVTIAHEFKHASQYQGSFWSEDGWVELDATWCEDAVYDSTNDYYNYLDSGSPIAAPALALDDGGSGSYEDCEWQEYMSQMYGDAIIRDLWERRKTHQSETMKTSYDSILVSRGSTMPLGYEQFMEWCYLTGTRAQSNIAGFGEAATYPTSPATTVNGVPWSTSGSVDHLAANFFRIFNAGSLTGVPRLTFTGVAGSLLQLHVVYHRLDGTVSSQDIPLDGANSANLYLTHSWSELGSIGVLVIDPKKSGGFLAYSVAMTQEFPSGVAGADGERGTDAAAPARFALEPNVPNPVTEGTRFRFRLPERLPVELSVFDAAGRVVARLVGGATLGAGEHDVVWDGRNATGRRAAAGVYAYRLNAGRYTETRKLLLVR